jgi:hypothetical protein
VWLLELDSQQSVVCCWVNDLLSYSARLSQKLQTAVQMGKISIIFYSMYGHIYKMAQAMKEGVDKVPGCEGVLYQVSIACVAQVASFILARRIIDHMCDVCLVRSACLCVRVFLVLLHV